MSKFNVESAFNELMKKVSALTAKVAAQTAVIELQNNKIEDQQRTIGNYFITIKEQTRVLADLSTKIEKIEVHVTSMDTSKSEMEKPVGIPSAQHASKMNVGSVAKEPHEKVTERARRATERAKNKAAPILQKTSESVSETAGTVLEDKAVSEEWKVVANNKKRTKKVANTIQKGGNSQIATLQAIQRKKFLHVWSLHPDTTEKAIGEHVAGICGCADIKVEKLVPKSARDYASFMVGVPESLFDKLNNVDSWPLNAQFSQWVWFRNSGKPAKGNQSQQ